MPAYYNEIDEFAAQWLRNLIAAGHLPPGEVDTRSILDIQPEDLNGYEQCHFFAGIGIWGYGLRRVGWPDDREIWSGSCPCQPFSAAGGRLGFADERHLWPAWYWLVTQRRPARIVGEQVASKDGLAWLDLVSTDLENAGYAFGAADLCAAGFSEQGGDRGGFHLRQRQYFVAECDELGDAKGDAKGERRRETRDEYQRGGQTERDCRAGDNGGMADADDGERNGRAEAPRRYERNGQDAGWSEGNSCLAGGIDARGVADAKRGRREMALLESRDSATSTRCGETSGVGVHGEPCDNSGRLHRVSDNDARWANANLVYCRDGRWRPIEPGALPLANAVPRSMGAMRSKLLVVCNAAGFGERDLKAARKYRAGALKAFGNALDAETVVGFLEAALPLAP